MNTNVAKTNISIKKQPEFVTTDNKPMVALERTKNEDPALIEIKIHKTRGKAIQRKLRQSKTSMPNVKPATMSIKKQPVSSTTNIVSEPEAVPITENQDPSLIQINELEYSGKAIQIKLSKSETSMLNEKSARISNKKQPVTLTTNIVSVPVAVPTTKNQDPSLIPMNKLKARAKAIQRKLRQSKTSMPNVKPATMSIKKQPVTSTTSIISEPEPVTITKIDDPSLIQLHELKNSGKAVQRKLSKSEISIKKQVNVKSATLSYKKQSVTLTTNIVSVPMAVPITKNQDPSLIQINELEYSGKAIQIKLSKSETSMLNEKSTRISNKKQPVTLTTNIVSVPVAVPTTKNQDPSLIPMNKLKTRAKAIQRKLRQSKTSMPNVKPATMSIKKQPVTSTTSIVSEPEPVTITKIDDPSLIQINELEYSGKAVQRKLSKSEISIKKQVNVKSARISNKKQQVTLETNIVSVPEAVPITKNQDLSLIRINNLKTRAKAIQRKLRQSKTSTPNVKPATMSIKKQPVTSTTSIVSEPEPVTITKIDDPSLIQINELEYSGKAVQRKLSKSEISIKKQVNVKSARISNKKQQVTLETNIVSVPEAVPITKNQDLSLIRINNLKTRAKAIQRKLRQSKTSTPNVKPATMSIKKQPVTSTTSIVSEPEPVTITKIDDPSLIQINELEYSGKAVQRKLSKSEISIKKQVNVKSARISNKKQPVTLETNIVSVPEAVPITKNQDLSLIRINNLKTRAKAIQRKLRQSKTSIRNVKPALMSIKTPSSGLTTKKLSVPVVPRTSKEHFSLNQIKELLNRVVMVQDKSTQTNRHEQRVNPAIVSIENDFICSNLNNNSLPKVPVVVPSGKNEDYILYQIKKLQNSYEAILETLRETDTKYDLRSKQAIQSLLNKPSCSATDNVNVPEISDHPNGKMNISEHKIDPTRTHQTNDEVIQDNLMSTNTNELENSATSSIINESVHPVPVNRMHVLPILVPRMGETNLENDQKLRNRDRQAVIEDNSRQKHKNQHKTKPDKMSIEKAPACSTSVYVPESVVDSKMDEGELEIGERIRKLRHKLDFPNGSKEKHTGMQKATPSVKKYVSEPDFSNPNWRMEYLERDTLRIVKNDEKCVNDVTKFLNSLLI